MSDHTTFTAQLESEVEPAPTNSAGDLLVQALNDYEKAEGELEEFRGCIALAENDENAALEDSTLSEAEVVSRVKDAQCLRSV